VMNSSQSTLLKSSLKPLNKLFPIQESQPQTPLTGDQKVQSPQLRTKDNVVHVGLSQPSESWKVSSQPPPENSPTYLNNKSLIVQESLMEISDVTEVCHPEPLSSLKEEVQSLDQPIHTKQSKEAVKNLMNHSTLTDKPLSVQISTHYKEHLLTHQSQLLLMLPTGNTIPQESSAIVLMV